MEKKLWVFIGRLNPPHKWHMKTIKQALSENDSVLLLLWDNWSIDENNPLSFVQRKELLENYFSEEDILDIDIIEDHESDEVWVKNIWKKIQEYKWVEKLKIYGWDFENDSAIQVIKEYEPSLGVKDVQYEELDRKKSTVIHNGKEYAISSTNLRQALRDQNHELALKLCNGELLEKIDYYFR